MNNETIVGTEEFLEKFPNAKPFFDFFKNKIKIRKEKGGTKDFYWLTLETRCSMRYEVRVNVCDDGSVYFGGWSHNREERPFEDWHRGNDLADGALCLETMHRFIRDVIDDLFIDYQQTEKATEKLYEQE